MAKPKSDAFQHGQGETVHGLVNPSSPAGGEGEYLDSLPTEEDWTEAEAEAAKKSSPSETTNCCEGELESFRF